MPLLDWITRDEDLRTADFIPYWLLDVVTELSHGNDEDGLLVQGDNLEALKALPPFRAGRVRCMNIDPPYNTRSAFFVMVERMKHAIVPTEQLIAAH